MFEASPAHRGNLSDLAAFPLSRPAGDAETTLACSLRSSGGAEPAPCRDHSCDAVAAERRLILAERVARALATQLHSRLQRLQIDCDQDQFVLKGIAPSYHVKQLAQHVAMAALGGRPVVNQIEVRSIR